MIISVSDANILLSEIYEMYVNMAVMVSPVCSRLVCIFIYAINDPDVEEFFATAAALEINYSCCVVSVIFNIENLHHVTNCKITSHISGGNL